MTMAVPPRLNQNRSCMVLVSDIQKPSKITSQRPSLNEKSQLRHLKKVLGGSVVLKEHLYQQYRNLLDVADKCGINRVRLFTLGCS